MTGGLKKRGAVKVAAPPRQIFLVSAPHNTSRVVHDCIIIMPVNLKNPGKLLCKARLPNISHTYAIELHV